MGEWYHRGGKKYRIRQFCRRDENGKKIYCYDKTHSFENTKKRDAFLRDIENKHYNDTLHSNSTEAVYTLNMYLDKWLEHKKSHLDPNTYSDYEWNLERYIRHFKPKDPPDSVCLGTRALTSIKSFDIQQVYDDMLARKLSARSVGNLHNVVWQALEMAEWWELIARNPAKRTKRPIIISPEIEILQPDEALKFLEAAKKDRLGSLFAFMLTNGPRPEECYGLQWPEVDLEKGRVKIFRVLKWNRKGGGWRLRDYPKTVASRRTLRLEPPIIAILKEWRKKQLRERLQAGQRYKNNNLVFCTPTGEPLYPTNVHRRHFKPVVKAAKINHPFHLYGLRHTFATLSLAAGVKEKKISRDLGHRKVAFTLDTYVKIVEEMHLEADGKLSSMIFPKGTKKTSRGGHK